MTEPWNPSALCINHRVANGLKRGELVYDHRFTGKTETLLAYIALNHTDAIVVTPMVTLAQWTRNKWKERYPKLPEPRFLSLVQLKNRYDIVGSVFSDECMQVGELMPFLSPQLRYCGGVKSW